MTTCSSSAIDIEVILDQPPSGGNPFATLLLISPEPSFPETHRIYTSAQGLAEDTEANVAPDGWLSQAVSAVFAQTPSVAQVAVARVNAPDSQISQLEVENAVFENGDLLVLEVNGKRIHFDTSVPAPEAVITEFVATVSAALPTFTFELDETYAGTKDEAFTLTGPAGFAFEMDLTLEYDDIAPGMHEVSELQPASVGSYDDVLTMVNASLSDWYSVVIESQAPAAIEKVATWIEANGKCSHIFVAQSYDSLEGLLTDAGYSRTFVLMYRSDFTRPAAAALAGRMQGFPPDAPGTGSVPWAKQPLSLIPGDTALQPYIIPTLREENANWYGCGCDAVHPWVEPGIMVDGQYADLVVTMDWFCRSLSQGMCTLVRNRNATGRKIPYTDAGVQAYLDVIRRWHAVGVTAGHFEESSLRFVDIPRVADIPPSQRQTRAFPPIVFETRPTGSIEAVTVRAYITEFTNG